MCAITNIKVYSCRMSYVNRWLVLQFDYKRVCRYLILCRITISLWSSSISRDPSTIYILMRWYFTTSTGEYHTLEANHLAKSPEKPYTHLIAVERRA